MYYYSSFIKFALFSLSGLLLFLSVNAQENKNKGTLSGTVVDSSGIALENASVRLLKASDSSVASSVLTSDKGKFNISGIAEGKYYLLVSYLGYKPIFRPVSFTK